jgi:hypothetical protein
VADGFVARQTKASIYVAGGADELLFWGSRQEKAPKRFALTSEFIESGRVRSRMVSMVLTVGTITSTASNSRKVEFARQVVLLTFAFNYF